MVPCDGYGSRNTSDDLKNSSCPHFSKQKKLRTLDVSGHDKNSNDAKLIPKNTMTMVYPPATDTEETSRKEENTSDAGDKQNINNQCRSLAMRERIEKNGGTPSSRTVNSYTGRQRKYMIKI